MQTGVIPVGGLSAEQVQSVLTAATAAPSLHNTQPWNFRCTPATIELHADPGRTAPIADPQQRELRLSCGAALLNLRVAIRALGVHPAVQLLPDHREPGLLAVIRPQGHSVVTPLDVELSRAIPRRHTNRRPFSATDVPTAVVTRLRQAAKLEQAFMSGLAGPHLQTLHALVNEAHDIQLRDPAFVAEFTSWTGRDSTCRTGVPARSGGPLPEPQDEWVLRDFSGGRARPRVAGKDFEPEPLIAVIGTFHDLPLAHLQAGQAMQRVLLAATAAGLAASFLSEVVEVPSTRKQLRELIVGGLWPQTVLRLGRPTAPATAPARLAATAMG
jgi:nitroreductase